ncbi:MAG TPA: glycosyltransferase family 39 protein [Terriglobia bacterium]|nr:glycosyltransferase family 39 protein [Terriglobia bacterium]
MQSGRTAVLSIVFVKLSFHLITATRYGIFRDELYYLASADNLDWGYVDQPPMIALLAWIVTRTLGTSLIAIRLLPAVAGALLVWLAAQLAKEMGGGYRAQTLAALGVAVAPIYLVMHHWMTMNAFEPLIWMGCAWCIVRAINRTEPRYWLAFGVLVGLGLETKYSIAVFVAGVVAGLLFTPNRLALKNRWFWIGAVCAFGIFIPNLLWLYQHDFPFLELMATIRRSGRDVVRGPLAFLADQAMILNPVLVPLWLGGLIWIFASSKGRKYRILGWTYVVVVATFIVLKGKNYYVAPVYPMLFAAGGIAFESLPGRARQWMPLSYATAIVLAGAIMAPLSAPILPVETYLRYQQASGIVPIQAENQETGPLPQFFADEFGWEEMVKEAARVYNSLPAEERASTAIFANSYGQAGAIDYFGPKYGLPKAISNHQSYWLWGPREYTGDTVIVLGSDGTGDREHFESVEVAGRAQHPYSRRDEHFDIFLCRKLNTGLRLLWPTIKNWS